LTDLKTKVERVSNARIFERSKQREVVIILEPPALVGFRLKGTKRTYWLPADVCYLMALKASQKDEAKRKGK
jgi:hypothetical protein